MSIKIGSDVEYILEKEGTYVPANRLFSFNTRSEKFLGSYGTDGCSAVYEARPRPATKSMTLVERIERILDESVKKHDCEPIGGNFVHGYPIGCHIHYGVHVSAINKQPFVMGISWPIRMLFADEATINKRLYNGYGRVNSGAYEPKTNTHCEIRTPGNFVVNKKIAITVFDYAKAAFELYPLFCNLTWQSGYDNTGEDFVPHSSAIEHVLLNIKSVYSYSHNLLVKKMIELLEISPVIPKNPFVSKLWNEEPAHQEYNMVPAFNLRMEDINMNFLAESNVLSTLLAKKTIYLYGLSKDREYNTNESCSVAHCINPNTIYLSPSLYNKIFSCEGLEKELNAIRDNNYPRENILSIKVLPSTLNPLDTYSIALPYTLRASLNITTRSFLVDILVAISKRM